MLCLPRSLLLRERHRSREIQGHTGSKSTEFSASGNEIKTNNKVLHLKGKLCGLLESLDYCQIRVPETGHLSSNPPYL